MNTRQPWSHSRLRTLAPLVLLLALAYGMPALKPLFARAFPELLSPLYPLDSFVALLYAHAGLVLGSSLISVAVGTLAALAVTRQAGRDFRPLLENLVAMGQTVPPVAVLAIAVPLIGFGLAPALIALSLYGLLPVVQGTLAGIDSVSAEVLEAARGLGMSRSQRLWKIELPLALPVLIGGIRTSVTINIGTAAIASAAGAKTLGAPIIVGLNGFNTAYVLQGGLLVGLLAIAVDLAFDRLPASRRPWLSTPPRPPLRSPRHEP